jgi:hypothetical protein
MEVLQKKTLETVLSIVTQFKEDSYVFESSRDFFNLIDTLILYNHLEEAYFLLHYILSKQESSGVFLIDFLQFDDEIIDPIFFLSSLTKYLISLPDQKTIKVFIKSIKRSLEYIEKHFDDHYLLYFQIQSNEHKEFSIRDNAKILGFADGLSDMLNHFEYTSLADMLFMIKGKLELGFQRYFWNNAQKNYVGKFVPERLFFSFATDFEICEVSENIPLDSDFLSSFLKEKQKKLKKESNVVLMLQLFNLFKQQQSFSVEKEILSLKKYLDIYPKQVLSSLEFSEMKQIYSSLFFDQIPSYKEFKKEKKVAFNLQSLSTMLELLKVLKNE